MEEYFRNLIPAAMRDVIASFQQEDRPAPLRGGYLPAHKKMQRMQPIQGTPRQPMQPLPGGFADLAPENQAVSPYEREAMTQGLIPPYQPMTARQLQPTGGVLPIADEGGAMSPQIQRRSAIAPIQGGGVNYQGAQTGIQGGDMNGDNRFRIPLYINR